ncbi:EDC3 [Cordylochernes scorpioides]|uniref:Enhancer of mRNA-decapping protein 3 n=1 Tax=Cordylochernes scorpioides TaxID=51811 RepID=A0ABY6LMF6_9ARAC|nr:EDC3 [Cordylochernes scorpioides]
MDLTCFCQGFHRSLSTLSLVPLHPFSCGMKSGFVIVLSLGTSSSWREVLALTGWWNPGVTGEHNIKRRSSLVRKSDGSKKWQNQRDEDCFNISKSSLNKEFDFEKNLALFDKRAVFEEIDAAAREAGGEAPTRLVDSNRRTKYRHDENILETTSPEVEQIILPSGTEKHYVTDTGLLVPCLGLDMREKLIKLATECGLSTERLLDMFGRAASEMVLQLLGGCHRLNPQNQHQQPKVVILCGPHHQGTQGITTGRHLVNHGVEVTLLISPVPCGMSQHQELNLYRLSGGREASEVSELPQDVDLVVGAMDGHNALSLAVDRALPRWAQACAAPALVLDPPPLPRLTIARPKWCLVPILPFPYAEDLSIYLCDLGIPRDVFQRLGIQYRSPFGSKFLIPLYKISKAS